MGAVAMLLAMLFMHIVDDYYLQGILAKMKQKSWWEEQVQDLDNSIYRNDYKMALCEHAFSWTCCVLALPALLWGVPWWLLLPLAAVNTAMHAVVDDGKANERSLNLVEDQLLHVWQVLASWLAIMAWRILSW